MQQKLAMGVVQRDDVGLTRNVEFGFVCEYTSGNRGCSSNGRAPALHGNHSVSASFAVPYGGKLLEFRKPIHEPH